MTAFCEDRVQSGRQEYLTGIPHIQWNAEQCTIVIRGVMVTLTPAEYRLLSPLRHGRPVTHAHLALQAYNRVLDRHVRRMMNKHIDSIRAKLEGKGIYVYCVLRYGYVLLDEILPQEEAY
jgi:DNA-binding response OmpR family regulator